MKWTRLFVLLSAFCLIFSVTSPAAVRNLEVPENWGIAISVPDEYIASYYEEEKEFYIFTEEEDLIPYVMVCYYSQFQDAREAGEFLIDRITDAYDDLEIVLDLEEVPDEEVYGYQVAFTYTLQGHQILDRRVLVPGTSQVYMFVSKEVPELGLSVGTLLEDTVKNSVILPEFADGSYDKSVLDQLEEPVEKDHFRILR